MKLFDLFRPFTPVATMKGTIEETCPYSLSADRFERTVVLSERGRSRRVNRIGRNCSIVSERHDITHWLCGGELPADARPIKLAS